MCSSLRDNAAPQPSAQKFSLPDPSDNLHHAQQWLADARIAIGDEKGRSDRVCDYETVLPELSTIRDALAMLANLARPLQQLVIESANDSNRSAPC